MNDQITPEEPSPDETIAVDQNSVDQQTEQQTKKPRKKLKLIIALLIILALLIAGTVVFFVIDSNKLKVSITSPEFGTSIDLRTQDVIKFDGEVQAPETAEFINVTAEAEGYGEKGEVTAEKIETGKFKFHFETRAPETKIYTFKFIADNGQGKSGSTTIDINVSVPGNDETIFTDNAVMLSDDGNCGEYVVTCVKVISGDWDEKMGETKGVKIEKTDKVKVGSILVASITKSTPYGLLKKVSKVTDTDGGQNLEFERAVLTDAYKQVHKNTDFDLMNDGSYVEATSTSNDNSGDTEFQPNVTQSGYKVPTNTPPGVAFATPVVDATIPVKGFILPFKFSSAEYGFNKGEGEDKKKVGGIGIGSDIEGRLIYLQTIHLHLNIDPHFQIGWPPMNPTVDFSTTRTENTDFTATLENASISASKTLFEAPDLDIPIPVIPAFVFSVSFEVAVGISVDTGIKLEANFKKQKTYGWAFKTSDGIKTIDEEINGDDNGIKGDFTDDAKDSGTIVEASAGPEVTLVLRINGSAKVAKAGFGLDFTLSFKAIAKYGSEKYLKDAENLNDCLDRTAIEVTEKGLFVRFQIDLEGTFVMGFEIAGWEVNVVEADINLGGFPVLGDAPLFSVDLYKKTEKTEEVVSNGKGSINLEKCRLMVLDTFFVGDFSIRGDTQTTRGNRSIVRFTRNEDGTELYSQKIGSYVNGDDLQCIADTVTQSEYDKAQTDACKTHWQPALPDTLLQSKKTIKVKKIYLEVDDHGFSRLPYIVIYDREPSSTSKLIDLAYYARPEGDCSHSKYYNPIENTTILPCDIGDLGTSLGNDNMYRVSRHNFLDNWFYLDKKADDSQNTDGN